MKSLHRYYIPRRVSAAGLFALLLLAALALPGRAGARRAAAYDVVFASGRVMDPGTSTDRIASVGIRGNQVAAVSAAPLEGARTIDARGLVVSPGFIDILSNEDPVGDAFKAADGVTTVL